MKRKLHCFCILLFIGGTAYGLIELIWRRRTHWSMILTGGICFSILYRIFRCVEDCSMLIKCCIGSVVITICELLSGFVFNFRLKMKVWDYSDRKLQFCGQICVLYSFLWGLLTVPIVSLCSLLHKRLGL